MSDAQPADLQTVLDDLQYEIRRHRQVLQDAGEDERPDLLADVRQRKWVNAHLPIGWPVMPRGLLPKLVAYAQKIIRRLLCWYINPLVEQQNAYNAALADTLVALHGRTEEQTRLLAKVTSQLERMAQTQAAQLERMAQTQAAQQQELQREVHQLQADQHGMMDNVAQNWEALRLRTQRLELWQRGSKGVAGTRPGPSPTDLQALPGVDYFVLGAMYRNEVQMRPRLTDYDDLLVPLAREAQGTAKGKPAVLDVGCGRGELVQHLGELGLAAYGIDIDGDAIAIGQAAGRAVRQEDAFAHLSSLDDGSLAAITMIQVVEHFEVEALLRLLQLAAAKLAPRGVIICETLNPACLTALSNWYLLDPSHRTPLHPQMLRFLLEQAELAQVEFRYLRPVPDGERLARLSASEPGAIQELAARLNRNIDRLNHILYGPQDYAAIARKPEE